MKITRVFSFVTNTDSPDSLSAAKYLDKILLLACLTDKNQNKIKNIALPKTMRDQNISSEIVFLSRPKTKTTVSKPRPFRVRKIRNFAAGSVFISYNIS